MTTFSGGLNGSALYLLASESRLTRFISRLLYDFKNLAVSRKLLRRTGVGCMVSVTYARRCNVRHLNGLRPLNTLSWKGTSCNTSTCVTTLGVFLYQWCLHKVCRGTNGTILGNFSARLLSNVNVTYYLRGNIVCRLHRFTLASLARKRTPCCSGTGENYPLLAISP